MHWTSLFQAKKLRKNVVSAAVEKIGAHPCCKNDLFNAVFAGTFEEPGNQIGISILEMYPSEKSGNYFGQNRLTVGELNQWPKLQVSQLSEFPWSCWWSHWLLSYAIMCETEYIGQQNHTKGSLWKHTGAKYKKCNLEFSHFSSNSILLQNYKS